MITKSIFRLYSSIAFTIASIYAFSSCQEHEGSEDQLKADVDSFAIHYYNWHFPRAIKYCTPESVKWLQYAASNVHDADIELLQKKPNDATIEISDIDYGDDEVTATITLSVENFLQMDTIGQEAHLVTNAEFHLPMVLHQGKWKVKLDKLP